jgi:C-terminal four TMM region of protein-O-mannosyltransferase/Dolichyl-phosphate-mannose-protein mannosyltransferase
MSTEALTSDSTALVLDGGRPLVRAGLRGFLDLGRFDVIAVIALVLVAFGLRLASPIFPDFLSGSGTIKALGAGYPTTVGSGAECTSVPVGAPGVVAGVKVSHTDVTVCGYVFDEIYFPVDAAKDLRQPAESYFDPEPPLAKLLMAPPIAIFGFNSWTWRLSTTLFGSLLVGLMYLIALRLRRDRFFAIATGLFICFDGLAFVESRTGVIDIIAIFLVALFYYAFLLHWQARTRAQWRTTLYVMAGVAGLAFGAKLTALAPLIVAAGLILARSISPYIAGFVPWLRRIAGPGRAETIMWRHAAGRRAVLHYLAAGVVALVIFFACFSRYETIQHQDVYFFTSCNPAVAGLPGTAKTLDVPVIHVGSVAVPNPVKAIDNIVQITAASLRYHAEECHSHPYSSLWLTWPVMEHPVLFYATSAPNNGPVAQVTDMGNPAIWWLGIIALLFCVWRTTRGPNWWRLIVPVIGLGSLAVMMVTYQAAVRFHAPTNQNTSYTGAQFIKLFHQQPSSQYEIARTYPGTWFVIAFAGVVLFAALVTLSAVISRRFVPAFIVLGYLASWMMWVPGNERRVLFFYHALGMLLFTALALAYALTALRHLHVPIGGRRVSLAPVAYAGIGAVLAAFIFFYPIWTAMPQSAADQQTRGWVDIG